MDPSFVELIEPAVVFATLLGVAFGVKFLIWGKGPIRRIRGAKDHTGLEQRVADLEDLATHQVEQLDELHERLDFAERLLTQQRAEEPRMLENPEVSTPV